VSHHRSSRLAGALVVFRCVLSVFPRGFVLRRQRHFEERLLGPKRGLVALPNSPYSIPWRLRDAPIPRIEDSIERSSAIADERTVKRIIVSSRLF
jgi:hypothetical protein